MVYLRVNRGCNDFGDFDHSRDEHEVAEVFMATDIEYLPLGDGVEDERKRQTAVITNALLDFEKEERRYE